MFFFDIGNKTFLVVINIHHIKRIFPEIEIPFCILCYTLEISVFLIANHNHIRLFVRQDESKK